MDDDALPFRVQLPGPPPNKALQRTKQQLGPIDLGCRLAAYSGDRIGPNQRCCWPLNADPLGGVAESVIDAISLIAEVSLGLAGFAGIAVAFGRGPGRWGGGDSLRIRLLLGAAFAALFASLVTTGAHWAGAGEARSIQLGAGALLVGQAYWVAVLARQIRYLEPAERSLFNPRLAALFRTIAFSSVVAQAVALSGFVVHFAAWLLLYGLLCCLAYAALGFVRLMFIRPASE